MLETIKDWAMYYASIGWPVFPCKDDKAPYVQGGCLAATTDPELIKRWWIIYPDANIGVATGNGLAVVDIDQEETPEGCVLPSTLTSKTNRGHHYWYTAPQPVKGGAHIGMPHVDLRGEGGYVIAPPSVHESGHVYAWCQPDPPDPAEMVQAPDWVLSRVHGAKRTDAYKVSDDEEDDFAWRPAKEGERDQRAVALAARQVKTGATNQRELANIILSWNERNEPPMGTLVGDKPAKDWAMEKAFQALQLAAGNGGRKIEHHLLRPGCR